MIDTFVSAIAERTGLVAGDHTYQSALCQWGFYRTARTPSSLWWFGSDEQKYAHCPFALEEVDSPTRLVVRLPNHSPSAIHRLNWPLWRELDAASDGALTAFAIAGGDSLLLRWMGDQQQKGWQ